jgi:hypothetical protein
LSRWHGEIDPDYGVSLVAFGSSVEKTSVTNASAADTAPTVERGKPRYTPLMSCDARMLTHAEYGPLRREIDELLGSLKSLGSPGSTVIGSSIEVS